MVHVVEVERELGPLSCAARFYSVSDMCLADLRSLGVAPKALPVKELSMCTVLDEQLLILRVEISEVCHLTFCKARRISRHNTQEKLVEVYHVVSLA